MTPSIPEDHPAVDGLYKNPDARWPVYETTGRYKSGRPSYKLKDGSGLDGPFSEARVFEVMPVSEHKARLAVEEVAREKAEQELEQVRELAGERLEVVDRLSSQLAEVRAEVERIDARISYDVGLDRIRAILDSAPSVAGDERGKEEPPEWFAEQPEMARAVMEAVLANEGDPTLSAEDWERFARRTNVAAQALATALGSEENRRAVFDALVEARIWDVDEHIQEYVWQVVDTCVNATLAPLSSTQQLPGKSLSREPGDREAKALRTAIEDGCQAVAKGDDPKAIANYIASFIPDLTQQLEEANRVAANWKRRAESADRRSPPQQSADPEVALHVSSGEDRCRCGRTRDRHPDDGACIDGGCEGFVLAADPEVPRCGGSGWIFPDPEQPMANEKCPDCPDCQSTPELLGEAKSSSDEEKAVDVLRRFMCCKAGEQFVDEKLLRPFGFTLDPGPVVRANRNLVDALEWIEAETGEQHTRDAARRAVDAASTQPESPGNYCDQCEKPKAEVANLLEGESLCAPCLLVRATALLTEAEGHDYKLTDADHCPFCGQDIAGEAPESSDRLKAATKAVEAWMLDHDLSGYAFEHLAADVLSAADRAVVAAITPLLPGSNYALELRERLEAIEALDRLAAYADYSRVEEDEELVRKALSSRGEEDEMSKKPSLSLGLIDHLRKEGEARSDLADGPIAALTVYAESSDEEVAKAAQEALAALDTPVSSEPEEGSDA